MPPWKKSMMAALKSRLDGGGGGGGAAGSPGSPSHVAWNSGVSVKRFKAARRRVSDVSPASYASAMTSRASGERRPPVRSTSSSSTTSSPAVVVISRRVAHQSHDSW